MTVSECISQDYQEMITVDTGDTKKNKMGGDRQVNREIIKPCGVCHERGWLSMCWELSRSQGKGWERQLSGAVWRVKTGS